MLTIGLTGGIACGKSTASAHLVSLGAHRIDADELARLVVAPGWPALAGIKKSFGPSVINPDGTLDRKALGKIVFNDVYRLRELNNIIHPCIYKEQTRQIEAIKNNAKGSNDLTIVIDAALMIETGRHTDYDLVMVVYCPERVQMRRLTERDGVSEAQARKRVQAQMPLMKKASHADFVIDTCGTKDETRRHINYLWKNVQRNRDQWIKNNPA